MTGLPPSSPVTPPPASLGRQLGTVGFWTLCSRVTGLLRDMVIAHYFGASAVADAFYVAFRIPNLLRRLLAEGALTMAFVPIYAEYRRESPEAAQRAANTIFTALFLLLLLLVGLGIVFSPLLVRLTAYGFADQPDKFWLTVDLTRIMFPYLLLVSLMALMMAILNSWRHFWAPAAAPVLLNLGLIGGAVVASLWFPEPAFGLAVGVLAGGVMQMLLQVPPLLRRGVMPRLTASLRHPALRQLVRIMIPAAFGGAVYQLNVLLVTLFASFLPDGSVSYLWYADRITEFPLGIFAVAIATVTLPRLSDHQQDGQLQAFRDTLNLSLRAVLALALPSMVGILVLATPIVRLLFEGGAFTAASTAGTVGALWFFAAAIPFVSVMRNIVPAFYAMKDAKTPVRLAVVGLVTNVGAAFVLMPLMQHRGLALAMALASTVHCVALVIALRRRIGLLGGRVLVRSAAGSGLAAALMGAVVWGVAQWWGLAAIDSRMALLPRLFATIAMGAVVYALGLRLCNPHEYRHLLRRAKRSKREGAPSV